MDRDKWTSQVWAFFHNGNLTRATRDVLLTLRTYAASGTAWPSHDTLAERSGTSPRTVIRALATAKGLGLVDWTPGGRWREGGVWRRRSNRYWLVMPEALPEPKVRPPAKTRFRPPASPKVPNGQGRGDQYLSSPHGSRATCCARRPDPARNREPRVSEGDGVVGQRRGGRSRSQARKSRRA